MSSFFLFFQELGGLAAPGNVFIVPTVVAIAVDFFFFFVWQRALRRPILTRSLDGHDDVRVLRVFKVRRVDVERRKFLKVCPRALIGCERSGVSVYEKFRPRRGRGR